MWPSWVLGTVVIVLFLIQLVVMPSAVQGAGAFSWVERKPAGDVNGKWLACASDATGQRLLAGDNGGRLWISADCGANWLRAGSLAGDTVRNWQACASDASGSTLLAGVYGGRLYVSADSGVSWTTASSGAPTTSQYWKAVASDTGGSTLVAAVYGGRLWLSVNRGITWSEVRPAGDTSQTWQALACDATGLHIMALTRNGLSYVSADRGGTWKEIRPGGIATVPWKACAMNADGSVLAAVSYPSALSAVGRVYRSADGGTTWTEQRPLGDVDQNWQAVAVSADGSRIVVAVDGGSVWTSPDGGVTWFGGQPAGVAAMRWQCCASSADGLRVTAGADEGRLYSGLATWSLSYACTTGGSLTGNSLQTVTHGGSGTMVTAVPDTGYHFVQWSDGILTATRMDTNVTADITVTATFAVNAYSITSSSGTNGTISPSTPQTVNYGSSVTFTVMPAAGYHVRDVLVDGNSVGAVTSCTFTGVMASHTITAAFSINTYAITVISGPRGVVTPCTGLLPYHTTQAYVVKPGAGYMINTLTVDGVVVNEATERLGYTVTLTSIEGPHTIAATFVPIPDLTAPTITFPRFNAVAGVSDWSDGAVQMFTVSVSPFALSFTLEDDSGSAKWTVKNNGCAVVGSIDSGVISCPLPLSEGRNDVEIITSDVPGNSSRRKLCIYLDSMSPVLRLDPSLPASISVAEATVKGSVSDAGSGLKHLVINGAEVIPYVDGSFGEKVMLARGANVIVIEAEDRVGHVTSATYRVTYAPPVPAPVAGHAMQLAIGSKTMSVDGMKVTLDAPAQIVQDRTLVPLRGLVEQLGGTTAWNAKARQVTLKARGTTMVLTIGKSSALVNGRGQPIDPTNGNVVPLLMSDRTMLPLRFVAENLGLQVAWNANTRVVTLSWED